MTDKYITTSEILQHRGTDFAGESALRLFAQILGAPCDGGSGQYRLRLCQIGERNAYGCRHTVESSHAGYDIFKQLQVGLQPTMHFPIACNQFLTHSTPPIKRRNYSQTVTVWSIIEARDGAGRDHFPDVQSCACDRRNGMISSRPKNG